MKLVPGALSALVPQARSANKFVQTFSTIFAAAALGLASLTLAPIHAAAQALPNAPAETDDNFHYNNSWEIGGGLGYAYLPSGPSVVPRASIGELNVAATQWIFPRWGATGDYRAYVGLGDTNVNPYTVNSPLFVENFVSVGPEYRWIRTPAIGISLHALAGGGYGVFNYHVPSGVTNKQIGIYSNGTTFDLIGGANIDFNTSSQFAVRISPNVFTSDFNGDLRPSFTITAGVVWRYGRF
jgi:hypothetical protein